MATQLFYDHLLSTAKLADISSEQPVETEILLADYDAPVFKIVKTTMEHLVTQKYIMHSKLNIEGFIKLTVYYQPPESDKISVVSQKVPFQKQLELAEGDYDLCFIEAEGQSQYVNTRPQNPTRIDVRGMYLFSVRVFAQKKVNAVTAISSDSVCCDREEISHFSLAGQNIRQFTAEKEIEFSENMSGIIRVHPRVQSPAITVFKDKITVKGEISADIYYTLADSADISKQTQVFAYNQLIDLKGIKENCIGCADVSVCGFSIKQNQDSKKYTAAITVQTDATAFSRQQVIAVKDAFSRRYKYEKTQQEILCDTNMYHIDKNMALRTGEKIGTDYTVKDVFVEISPLKTYYEINKTTAKAKAVANIIVLNSRGEYECISKAEDIVLDWLENCTPQDEICIKLSADSFSCNCTGDEVQINAAISAKGFVIEKRPFIVLKAFEENTEAAAEKNQDALVLYYAKKGEKVFEIAKKHNADPQDISVENCLQADTVAEDTMLFIPSFSD